MTGAFLLAHFLKLIQYDFQNIALTKMHWSDLDSPRRELSNGGLKSVVALLVRWQINYLCVCN